MSTLQLITDAVVPMAGGSGTGIFDWATIKVNDFNDFMKVVAAAAVTYFVLKNTVKSGGAFVAFAGAAVVGLIFLWYINNTDTAQKHVDEEINSSPALVQVVPVSVDEPRGVGSGTTAGNRCATPLAPASTTS